MRMRVVVPMVLALVAGLAAVTIIGSLKKPQQAPREKRVVVVVAQGDLPAAQRLSAEMLTEVRMSPGVVPADCFSNKDELIGRVLSTEVRDRYPITEAFLAPEGAMPGLQGKIPPGYRARSISINETTAVGGFLEVGSHVDVVATTRAKGARDRAETVLKNVEVLAVGTRMTEEEPRDNGGTRARPKEKTVTLLLTPEEVNVIAEHEANGDRLSLSLRSGEEEPGDADLPFREEIAAPEMPAPKDPVAEKDEPAPLPRQTIAIIRGNEVVYVTYVQIDGQWMEETKDGRYRVPEPSEMPSSLPKLRISEPLAEHSADATVPEAKEASVDESAATSGNDMDEDDQDGDDTDDADGAAENL